MFLLYQSRWWSLLVRGLVPVTVLAYFSLVFEVQEALIPIVRHTLRWAVAFGAVQIALLVLGILSLAVAKFTRERQDTGRRARTERIESLLTEYILSESEPVPELRECFSRWPSDFVTVLGRALQQVHGNLLSRLHRLTEDSEITNYVLRESLRHNPKRVTAVLNALASIPGEKAQEVLSELCSDARIPVRHHARRLLIRCGSQSQQLEMLNGLSSMPSWERIQVFQQLPVTAAVIPQFLEQSWASSEDPAVISALELVLSLQRFFGTEFPFNLAMHRNFEVRIRFFRAVPFLSTSEQALDVVEVGLNDEDWRVRAMAARAGGLLRLGQLGPLLIQQCTSATHNAEVGHAARALAALGGHNWDQLRQMVNAGNMPGRQVADVIQETMMRSSQTRSTR
jgi:hypothetical protein